MRGDDRGSVEAQQPSGDGGPGQRDLVKFAWVQAAEDEGSSAQGSVVADFVADTVEALQARRDERDRDALRGTIDPRSGRA